MGDTRDALEAENRRLKSLLASTPAFISQVGADGRFIYLNRTYPGYTPEQILGTRVLDYIPPEDQAKVSGAIERALTDQEPQQIRTSAVAEGHPVRYFQTLISPVQHDGEPSVIMIGTDITELEGNRLRLQLALDATEMGLWTYEPGAGGGEWDAQTQLIFGSPGRDEAPTLEEMNLLIHEDDREMVMLSLQAAAEQGRYGPLQHRILRPDGVVRWVSASGAVERTHDGGLKRILGTVRDITEQRMVEARLVEAQKLESIGRLAGGIAHDFNNMLTTILGNLELAIDELSPETNVLSLLGEARVAADHSAELTAQLLAFARRQVIEPRVINPNELVGQLDVLLRRLLGEHISLSIELAGTRRIRVDPNQVNQVLLNLATNARDAMSEGGRLTIETADVDLDESYTVTRPDANAGPHLVIAVSDSGSGIAPQDLVHLFEPFFTTRRRGTGLGLAMCHGIVKQNGGHISVYSELGRGTTFKVYLPASDAPAEAIELRSELNMPIHGNESVLVVEDEPLVRAILERSLLSAGYQVTCAPNSPAALDLVEQGVSFDLLITDVVMPELGGRELATRVREHQPELPVLFISGYTENAIVHNGVLDSGLTFLQKPFVPRVLLETVRRLLDATERDG